MLRIGGYGSLHRSRNNCAVPAVTQGMAIQLIQPELHLRDGRTIHSITDAIALLREHEARPGVDARDEVLHGLERARTEEERRQAVDTFIGWAEELDLLMPSPEITGQHG
jgi:hypothetical protein